MTKQGVGAIRNNILGGAIGEPEKIGPAELRIAAATALRNTHKAECFDFADCWADGMTVNAILLEIVVGDRQVTGVLPAVMSQLNLNATEDTSRRQTQCSECRQLDHLDKAGCKLSADRAPTVLAVAHGSACLEVPRMPWRCPPRRRRQLVPPEHPTRSRLLQAGKSFDAHEASCVGLY